MNKENEWDQMVETEIVKEQRRVLLKEIVAAMQKMKSRKTTGLSEVSVEMTAENMQIRVKVMMGQCQRVSNGRGMPDGWKTSVIVPLFLKERMM